MSEKQALCQTGELGSCYSCECCYTCQVLVNYVDKSEENAPPTMEEYEEYLNHEPIRENPIALLSSNESDDGRKILKLSGIFAKILYFLSFRWLKIRWKSRSERVD